MPTIKHRRATQAQWSAENPVLAAGEIGYEFGNNKLKVGDGVSAWNDLTYFIDEAFVRSLIGSGGGGASIDDNIVGLETSWSSKKTSDEVAKKAEDVFVVMTEEGLFINPVNGQIVEFEEPTDHYPLGLGLAMTYDMAIKAQPKYLETRTLIPGPITVGLSPLEHRFRGNPPDIKLNRISFLSIKLDAPSTSGQIRFRIQASDAYGGQEYIIPEGVSVVYYDDPEYVSRPQWGMDDGSSSHMGVEILDAGTGAEGFNVEVIRGNG